MASTLEAWSVIKTDVSAPPLSWATVTTSQAPLNTEEETRLGREGLTGVGDCPWPSFELHLVLVE